MKLQNIIDVKVLENYNLKVVFDDGIEKLINVKPFIKNGVSANLLELDYFSQVQLKDGFIEWPNGFDFCPVFLYNYNG